MKDFTGSFVFTAVCLGIAFWWGGFTGLFIAAVLGVLEVSLSFDNAVINASVLKTWNQFWKTLFLTVGILVAVFGMRLLFPLLIVAHTADMGLYAVAELALTQPLEYSRHLTAHHAEISAFGGIFLLLVFLYFLLENEREHHWIAGVERTLGRLGRAMSALPLFIALATLLAFVELLAEPAQRPAVLAAGVWGIVIYLGVHLLSKSLQQDDGGNAGAALKQGGIGGFLYLEVLDASFSFDGVIGAFAITSDIVIIMLGLGIGAIFVRSLTVFMVNKGTLSEYVYLEHGAHYAVGALALIMLASMKLHIPEIITGLIGVAFIGAALWSSLRYNAQTRAEN